MLRVALPEEVTTLDPWSADAASLVATRQIFETLVEIDSATSVVTAGLASSWLVANDGATWTFILREGVQFHDGATLEASAVAASFERGRATSGCAPLLGPCHADLGCVLQHGGQRPALSGAGSPAGVRRAVLEPFFGANGSQPNPCSGRRPAAWSLYRTVLPE